MPFAVRVSARARRVRLTVTPRDGLVVVAPAGWRGDPAAVVAAHAEWATHALARIAEKRAQHAAGPEALMPRSVTLGMTGERLEVVSRAGSGVSRARRIDACVEVRGGDDASARLGALSRWLDREARLLLAERLGTLAAASGATPAGVRVRRNRSRWGSCTAKGSISLSRNLVFLPPELVDSVILHEIAHLSVLDHSARFYARLATLDPEWRTHRERLKDVGSLIPAWADA